MRCVDVFERPFVLVLFPFNTKGKHQSNVVGISQVISEKKRIFAGPHYGLLSMFTHSMSGFFREGRLLLFLLSPTLWGYLDP